MNFFPLFFFGSISGVNATPTWRYIRRKLWSKTRGNWCIGRYYWRYHWRSEKICPSTKRDTEYTNRYLWIECISGWEANECFVSFDVPNGAIKIEGGGTYFTSVLFQHQAVRRTNEINIKNIYINIIIKCKRFRSCLSSFRNQICTPIENRFSFDRVESAYFLLFFYVFIYGIYWACFAKQAIVYKCTLMR